MKKKVLLVRYMPKNRHGHYNVSVLVHFDSESNKYWITFGPGYEGMFDKSDFLLLNGRGAGSKFPFREGNMTVFEKQLKGGLVQYGVSGGNGELSYEEVTKYFDSLTAFQRLPPEEV